MRPVRRGGSPEEDFSSFRDAKEPLVSRLGAFCSYCERHVDVQLAVEHIRPKKGPFGCPDLEKSWRNFLLACANCNSTKGHKEVLPESLFFPDRDNTAAAFRYLPDGTVEPATGLKGDLLEMALNTLQLTGLDRRPSPSLDENGRMIAMDRVAQRMQAWAKAEEARNDVEGSQSNETLRKWVVELAISIGFFSVWMTVFHDDAEMRKRFILAFDGTKESGCFDPKTSYEVSPAPNPDDLAGGGKI